MVARKFILVLFVVLSSACLINASGSLYVDSGYCMTKELMTHSLNLAAINIPSKGSGFFVDVGGAYWYFDWWGIGGKVSYSLLTAYDRGYMETTSVDFCKILFGIPVIFKSKEICWGFGIYAGYGFLDISSSGGFKASGSAMVFDFDLKFETIINSTFSIIYSTGYTIADFAKLKVNGMPDAYQDMSNIRFGLGLNYRFTSEHWPFYD